MDMEVTHTEDVPHNELTELCNQMLDVIHTPEHGDIQAVVMLQRGEEGGMGLHGYDDAVDASTSILYHAKALLEDAGTGARIVVVNQAGKVRAL